jgi:type I restriction enzyme S subunit
MKNRPVSIGSTILHINTSDLYKFKVPIPISGEEQRLVENRLLASQRLIDSENKEAMKLRAQKSSLMHDLLTGKVRVTPDPEEADGA